MGEIVPLDRHRIRRRAAAARAAASRFQLTPSGVAHRAAAGMRGMTECGRWGTLTPAKPGARPCKDCG